MHYTKNNKESQVMNKVVAGLLLMFAVAASFLVLNPSPYSSDPRNTVFALRAGLGGGSGVLVAPNTILTAAHVVDGSDQLIVDYKGYKVPVSVIKIDRAKDLALVQVLGIDCPCAPIAEGIKLDEAVSAVGFPLLITQVKTNGNYQGTATYFNTIYSFFTTSIAPGSSGGGVFNSKGALVGVTNGIPTIPVNIFSTDLMLYLAAGPTLKEIQDFLNG